MKTIQKTEVKKIQLSTHWYCDHCGKECFEVKHTFRFHYVFRTLCDNCLKEMLEFFK